MILQSFVTFLPALLAGFGLVHLLWGSRGNAWALPLKASLGIGLGLGITSCIYFFRLLLFPGQGGYLLIELAFLVAVLIALFVRKRFSFDHSLQLNLPSWMQVLFTAVALLILFNAVSYSLAFARASPHGDYDAQAIWNLRARFIYRSGDAWEQAFSPEINRNFHMDYPLLVPLNVVGGWNTLGEEVLRVPAVQSMLFLYGIAGVIYFLIAYLRSNTQAALTVIILLATPRLLLYTGFQTADVAVAYYFLAALVFLILAFNENNPRLLFLSGMMAGIAAWTKNEGIPFLLLIILVAGWLLREHAKAHRLIAFFAGLTLPLVTIIVFKVHLPASNTNDLFAGNEISAMLSKLFDPVRYIAIFNRLGPELFQLGGWTFSIIIVLVLYGLIVGQTKHNTIDRRLFLLPLLQLSIYFGVYLITPYDLNWHMNYSMDRLLIHLFPMALLSFFLFVNTPEDALGFKSKN
jgi:hypothetical protein